MPKRAPPVQFILFVLMVVVGAAWLLWRLRLQTVDRAIAAKQAALKNLHVSPSRPEGRDGQLPPSPEVVDYLNRRTASLEETYQAALSRIAPVLELGESQSDTQLLFQERSHAVQRTLERFATARNMTAPTQLGFPKDLPPPEAVPRFLVQVSLIEQTAELLMAVPGVTQVESFKVEDPQAVTPTEGEEDVFLTSLPVRIRMTCALEVLTKALGSLDRADPLVDLQGLRMTATSNEGGEEAKDLAVELVVARYMVTAPKLPADSEDEEPKTKLAVGTKHQAPSDKRQGTRDK
ncbi:MAG: hypothetical protein A2105_05375 [Omnitrophica WOR_2 bacterium GWF2_63_9]|nr:MAG: hypothetical protein A2105_05375 [Omnitrophica WOR_2 bacterium GWF2_63_9]